MSLFLDPSLSLLAKAFDTLRSTGDAVVLASIVATEGSTYRKAGARMLITRGGEIRGLLSGGCLEHDLLELSRRVLDEGEARLVSYDTRGPQDEVFGFGAGCEGVMHILLQRVGPEEGWQPLDWLAARVERDEPGVLATVMESRDATLPVGASFWAGGCTLVEREPPRIASLREAAAPPARPSVHMLPDGRVFVAPVSPPPKLILLGAGPDAEPLAELALKLGFRVTLADHRPAYADAARFPGATAVLRVDADRIAEAVDLRGFDAAVVMSHYLPADAAYLRALARSGPSYVGLLGPSARRERLLGDIGKQAASGLLGRLRSPVGLDIGARSPEVIALAIMAEIHAALAGAPGGMSTREPR
jgi:xanthine/CO dehydrogenase XdhC/CoxF family maturation factor